jgi:malate dehydrogenase (oxaloacetate-decarboxylating)(NADP+)
MRADAALLENIRNTVLPDSSLRGAANLLIMPNLDAARIAYDVIKVLGNGTTIGPVLLGLKQPVHILTPSATVRRILNASALAVVDAQILQQTGEQAPARKTG